MYLSIPRRAGKIRLFAGKIFGGGWLVGKVKIAITNVKESLLKAVTADNRNAWYE